MIATRIASKVVNVRAEGKPCKMSDERRKALEQTRNMTVRRIQQDLHRIAERETAYAKRMWSELVPVKVTWDGKAWTNLKDFIPIRIEVEDPTVVKEADDDNRSDAPIA